MNEVQENKKNSMLILWIVLIATPIVGATTDIFVPSLPAISKYFSAAPEATRLSVTVYLIVYGLIQPFSGILADGFGRRNIIILSLIGFTITTLSIPQSPSIYALLTLRGIQGGFAAGLGVSLRSITSDTFSGMQLKKYASYVVTAWGIGPVLSPYLGGYLQHLYGWKASFYFLACYSFIMLIIVIFWLPETILQKHRFHIKVIQQNFSSMLKHPVFIGGAIICGLCYGVITIYNVAGPYLIQSTLGYSAIVYGRVALFLGIGWLAGNVSYRFMVSRIPLLQASKLFCSSFLVIAIIWLVLALTGTFNLWTTAIPPILIFICAGILFSYYFGQALSLFRHIGGSASALLGSIFSILAGLMSLIGSWLPTQSLFAITMSYLALGVLIFLFYLSLIRTRIES